jgi:hypothetical protein
MSARIGAGERGRLQRAQAGDRGTGTTSGANTPGVVDHHGGVVAGDAKVDAEQANRRRQLHGSSSTRPTRHERLGRPRNAPTTATVPGHLA